MDDRGEDCDKEAPASEEVRAEEIVGHTLNPQAVTGEEDESDVEGTRRYTPGETQEATETTEGDVPDDSEW